MTVYRMENMIVLHWAFRDLRDYVGVTMRVAQISTMYIETRQKKFLDRTPQFILSFK